MREQPKRTGRTFIASNLKKQKVRMDKNGNLVEDEPERPKNIQEYVERRRQRMGRWAKKTQKYTLLTPF